MKAITLAITNVDSLSDGGPMTFRSVEKPFEIGRDPHREWTLPDPRLFISGRHCEIVFDGQEYLLNDVSRNGTFVNGSRQRVKNPYRLQSGDQLAIGDYVIAVRVDETSDRSAGEFGDPWGGGGGGSRPVQQPADDDIWGASTPGPQPADRRDFRPKPVLSPSQPDFVRSNLDIPLAKPNEPGANPFGQSPSQGYPQGPFAQPQPAPSTPNPFGPAPAPAPNPFEPAPAPQPPNPFGASTPSPFEQPPRPVPPPPPQPMPGPAHGGGDMLSAFKLGARLPAHALGHRNGNEVAQEIGAMLHLVAEQMAQLLKARASAKAMVKTRDRTVIGALDNNPLKFMADPSEALEVMLSKDRSGYLDGMRALREAFDDIRVHEMATYAAMQKALSRLLADLSPEAIEAKVDAGAFSNKKAKSWETFVQRWDAKTEAHENGMLDVFLTYFSEAYQDVAGKKRS